MHFNISLHNIFNKKNKFKNIFSYYKPISKNKNIELELLYTNFTLFKLEIDLHFIARDHAGVLFELNLFGYEGSFKIYDSRHWDYENWCWETPNKNKFSN